MTTLHHQRSQWYWYGIWWGQKSNWWVDTVVSIAIDHGFGGMRAVEHIVTSQPTQVVDITIILYHSLSFTPSSPLRFSVFKSISLCSTWIQNIWERCHHSICSSCCYCLSFTWPNEWLEHTHLKLQTVLPGNRSCCEPPTAINSVYFLVCS